jgi:hypothetical protein
MPTTDRILDWATVSAAGIDTERVEIEENQGNTSLEMYRITSVDGMTSMVFGEYADREEGGWDSMAYEAFTDCDHIVWEPIGAPDWYETPAALLAAVRDWADRY